MSQTKLLFSEANPASVRNRATHVGPPAPIIIERLLPQLEVQENMDSTKSSFSFTTLSEERLQAAVKLAKRDVRRRRLEALAKSSIKPSQEASLFETSDVELLQELGATPSKAKSKASSPKQKGLHPGGKKHTAQKAPVSPMPRAGLSPPTRDPGLKPVKREKDAPLKHEIHKLQNELEVYIRKVEALSKRGERNNEPLELEEQIKLENLRQKQAARSARNIYVLQRQVKEVQEDIEKLRGLQMEDAKKTLAINRLAAAHRAALRALQVIIHQLSDLSQNKLPPHYKELSQLIRQLSLCSAKVEVEQGSAVPETALNILQKLETLDSAVTKQEMLEKMQAQACPPIRTSPHRSTSPTSAPKGPGAAAARGAGKSLNPRRGVRGKRTAPQKIRAHSVQPVNRREVLRAGLESLAQQRELKELQKQSQANKPSRRGLHWERKRADVMKNPIRKTGFQQPTVSSRLRVNQLPQKERSVPWIPTSPHSPPHRSPQRGRAEPRCLFSPERPSQKPPQQNAMSEPEMNLSQEKRKEAHKEALRKAWLDTMTRQRVKELNQLSREEADRIERLRSEVVSPTQWAERAEQKARERIQPLLEEAQRLGKMRTTINWQAAQKTGAEESSELRPESLFDDGPRVAWAAETDRQLEDMAQRRLQAPTLESMLLRMEEIQRDQEEVRRRFATITYSDPLYWDRPAAGPHGRAPGSRPASPQPIRLTRPMLTQTSTADIVLQTPVEPGCLSETSQTEEEFPNQQRPLNPSVLPGAVTGRGTVLSVPSSALRSIRQYREDYDSYLRAVGHDDVGGFDPWATAESIADELLWEAVADVAAEFQDVVEDYAEAVFTSEFLQPIQSPPSSAALSP